MLCEVILSGFAGGEYFPLPASKGPAFPFLLTLDGYPTSPADYAQKQWSPLKNSGSWFIDVNVELRRGIFPGMAPFIPGDTLKGVAAALLYWKFNRTLNQVFLR